MAYGSSAFEAPGIQDSYRAQQAQQQQAQQQQAAALRTSPSVDMLPASPGAGSGIPLPPGSTSALPSAQAAQQGGGGGGMGMRHHASFSSLRSSMSGAGEPSPAAFLPVEPSACFRLPVCLPVFLLAALAVAA
jgi:hypothetical protein